MAGIPYSREYDILTSLEKRGFVQQQPGRPRRYKAIDPKIVLKKELEEREKAIDKLLKAIAPLYDRAMRYSPPEEAMWVIRGVENIQKKIIEMINSARKEILIIGVHPISTPAIGGELKKAAKRGVKVKALGMFDDYCKAIFDEIGANVHDYKHDHSRFILLDNKELILASQDPGSSFFALYNKNPSCIKLYQSYFKHIWNDVKEK